MSFCRLQDAARDAAEGALLIIPTRVVSVRPVPADMIDAICEASLAA